MPSKKNDEKIPFFNLGPKNDWKKILDEAQQTKLVDIFREDLIKLGYEKNLDKFNYNFNK